MPIMNTGSYLSGVMGLEVPSLRDGKAKIEKFLEQIENIRGVNFKRFLNVIRRSGLTSSSLTLVSSTYVANIHTVLSTQKVNSQYKVSFIIKQHSLKYFLVA